jgi:hypothetical protein
MTWRSNLRTPVVVSIFLMAFLSPAAAKVIFVDVNAPGPNHDGSSWENAYNYLQDALSDAYPATKPVEIRVAQGIYKPDQGGSQTPGERTATFQLINGVTLKGGYAGFGEPDPNKRDIILYETTLSGDLDGNDVQVNDPCDLLYEPTRAENSYHVVISKNRYQTAVLDGFTITAGNANGSSGVWDSPSGGGMYNAGPGGFVGDCGSPTLINCTFFANSAQWSGGGIYNSASERQCTPIFIKCTFTENYADYNGGGMCNGHSIPRVGKCNPDLIDCTFIDNSSGIDGGGFFNGYGDSTLTNCKFTANSAEGNGGGMANCGPSSTLTNCVLSGNKAKSGGGFYAYDSSITSMTNCTLAGNEATNGCTLVTDSYEHNYPSNIQLTNCILRNDGNEIHNNDNSTIEITYSNVKSAWPGLGNIDTDPCFVQPGYWDSNGTPEDANDDFWVDGDYHLKSQAGRWDPKSESWVKDDVTSPCIDAGNPGCPVGDEPEPNGNRRNMGAYGGTAEASKSPTYWRSLADTTNDWIVDPNDLKVLADYWLQTGECIPSDFDRSRFVNFNDFAILGGQWRQKGPGPGMTYDIGGCIPVDFPSSTAEEPNETRFTVMVEGRNIYFEDMMQANCCPEELDVQMTLEDNLITIYEIERFFTRVPCPCICDYPITAKLGPFDPGTYIFEVYQKSSFIGSTVVTIENGQ